LEKEISYAQRYTRLLVRVENIRYVLSYKFKDGSWREEIFGMMRWVLGYTFLLKTARQDIKTDLPRLLIEGRSLMPDLYPNPQEVITNTEKWLGALIAHGAEAPELEDEDAVKAKERRFQTRLVTMLTGLGLIGNIGLAVLGILWINPLALGFAFIGSFAVILIHWNLHWHQVEMLAAWGKEQADKYFSDELRGVLAKKTTIHSSPPPIQLSQPLSGWAVPSSSLLFQWPERRSKAMTAALQPGGIDFNFEPQFIKKRQGNDSAYFNPAGFVEGFDRLRGFYFRIVRFKTRLTIDGAFGLMLHSSLN
ncbi:MAG: hypothetical protein HQL13_03875, partial [Candidatus Omnitrophica bacterium]|nr:hypothetical protein [Candidatus Omnitrophota bacterium]